MVPTNTGVFLQVYDHEVKARPQQVLLESKKKNVGNHAFSEISIHNSKKSFKIQIMSGIFFPNLSSLISENWVVTPNFIF